MGDCWQYGWVGNEGIAELIDHEVSWEMGEMKYGDANRKGAGVRGEVW